MYFPRKCSTYIDSRFECAIKVNPYLLYLAPPAVGLVDEAPEVLGVGVPVAAVALVELRPGRPARALAPAGDPLKQRETLNNDPP